MKLSPEETRRVLEMYAAQGGAQPHPVGGVSMIGEKWFQQAVTDAARRHGWLCYHTRDSRKSAAGFPDLTLIRGEVLVAAELKVGDNPPTAAQQTWLEAFGGVRVVRTELWRPEMWSAIEETLR